MGHLSPLSWLSVPDPESIPSKGEYSLYLASVPPSCGSRAVEFQGQKLGQED